MKLGKKCFIGIIVIFLIVFIFINLFPFFLLKYKFSKINSSESEFEAVHFLFTEEHQKYLKYTIWKDSFNHFSWDTEVNEKLNDYFTSYFKRLLDIEYKLYVDIYEDEKNGKVSESWINKVNNNKELLALYNEKIDENLKFYYIIEKNFCGWLSFLFFFDVVLFKHRIYYMRSIQNCKGSWSI